MKICLGTTLVCHQLIITMKLIILLLLLLPLLATFFLVVVLCFEVSEPLPYTKGGHNVYIAKERTMVTKKDINSDIKKGNILTNFEKSTLIGAIIVILTGLIVYGRISRSIFGPFNYPHLYAPGFSRI